jgi:hypothetical protein
LVKLGLEKFGLEKVQSSRKSECEAASNGKASDASCLKRILYPGWRAGAMLAFILCLAAASAAQRGDRGNHEDKPEIAPQDKVLNKKKKGGEPRAVGVLQITDKGKATLVPIAILIDGKFHDASVYKADPVPMALEGGTVYEGERTGTSLGLFTVNGALHSKDANSSLPWIGTGQWLVQGADVKKTTHKAEDVPVGLVTKDEPPRLTKSAKAAKDAGTSTPANGGTQTTGSSPSSGSKPADTSSSSAPQKAPDQTKTEKTSSNQTSPANADASKPSASDAPKSEDAAPAPGEDTNSQAGDANRPKLRRGKPTEPLPADQDVPGYAKVADKKSADAKPGSTATPAELKPDASAAKPDKDAGTKTPPELIPAISDSSGPDPRSFVYEWGESEEGERRKEVVALAQQQLHAYLQERAKNSIAAQAAPTKAVPVKASSARKPPAKVPDLVLEELQIRTFDLWAHNQPVIVLTATAHPPLPAVASAASGSTVPEYSITLVARTDIYNNLHKLYVGVTDKYHLDVTPRLELIDAVDADGDGRGELLFRETSDAGSGYIIYRATGDTLWKMFDSLRPE